MRFRELWARIRDYLAELEWSFSVAVVPLCYASMVLYTRHPTKTNFIFDEQEALLANPYIHGGASVPWLDAFRRDFWGRLPEFTIGSYRPLPNVLWRALWNLGARAETPFLQHWANVLLHGVNGALVASVAFTLTRRRAVAWLAGILFVSTAVLTEAVSGVVGTADVLGGLGALMALSALSLPTRWMGPALFGSTLFGLYSKETVLSMVPLVPLAALVFGPRLHPTQPRHALRATFAALLTGGAFIFYVESRRRLFPTPIAAEYSIQRYLNKPLFERALAAALRWYAQPALPHDPLNNPLINAAFPYRIGGALRVFAEGLGQIFFPWTLSADYSACQEPIPERLFSAGACVGVLVALVLFAFGLAQVVRSWRSGTIGYPGDVRAVTGFFLLWALITYFPVSNIPILLPTVRAERFWYLPVIGTSIVLAVACSHLFERVCLLKRVWVVAFVASATGFLSFQCFAARRHANDYVNDLAFWDATRRASPRSAKAHLNYSVMCGARGDQECRLASNHVALELAPTWAMAQVYYGDTLCRMKRVTEAWPYYLRGFELSPNDKGLIALGLQCLWDEQFLEGESPALAILQKIAVDHPGSWLSYLSHDIAEHGSDYDGVDPRHRPRKYNEGPK